MKSVIVLITSSNVLGALLLPIKPTPQDTEGSRAVPPSPAPSCAVPRCPEVIKIVPRYGGILQDVRFATAWAARDAAESGYQFCRQYCTVVRIERFMLR